MDFKENFLATQIETFRKDIAEAKIKLSNSSVSLNSDLLKQQINRKNSELNESLVELKSLNSSHPSLKGVLESDIKIEETFLLNEDFNLEAGTFDPETYKITIRSILEKAKERNDLNVDLNIEKPHSFLISNGNDESIFLIEDVALVKQLSEESSRSFLGTAAKGLGGLVILGPLGLLAGILTKKKKTTIFLGIEFNDGNKIICSINKDSKIFYKLQSSLMRKYEF